MTHALKREPNDLSVTTRLFGPLRVPLESVIEFPRGLPGFDGAMRFALLPATTPGLLWLQSIDTPALAFLLVEIARLLPEAVPEGVNSLAIVTLPDAGSLATANLRAPVVIDAEAGLAEQVILSDESLSTTFSFDLAELLQR